MVAIRRLENLSVRLKSDHCLYVYQNDHCTASVWFSAVILTEALSSGAFMKASKNSDRLFSQLQKQEHKQVPVTQESGSDAATGEH